MAERTVNVRINYQVNTAEIQRAQVASQAAQKATDDLRKASEQYGKAAAAAHKENAAGAKQASADIGMLAKDFNNLYSTVKLVMSAGIARELIDTSLNLAKMSGQVEGVSKAFNRIPQATLLINQLRKATHGTVTDLELMQKALTAQNFRIPLEKLGTLLEFAAVKAQQTGQEVNHLVDYIVSGIGYRSIKRLDDLGFTANRVKEALGGVSLQAADMGQVMDAVTSLMQEDLEKTGGFVQTSATQVEKLVVKWNDLKLAVSQALTSPALLKFYEGSLDALKAGVDFIFGNLDDRKRDQAQRQAAEEVENFKTMYAEILKEREKGAAQIEKEIASRERIIEMNRDELEQLRQRFKELTDNGKMMSVSDQKEVDRIRQQSEFYQQKNFMLRESVQLLGKYKDELEKVSVSEGGAGTEYIKFKATFEALSDANPIFVEPKISEEDSKRINDQMYDFMVKELAKDDGDTIAIGDILFGPEEKRKEDWELLRDEFKTQWRGILSQGFSDTANFLHAIQEAELAAMETKFQRLEQYYSDELQMAGDNEEAKKAIQFKSARELQALRNQMAQKEWAAKRNSVLIDTAAGIAKNIAEYPWPTWIVPVALTAAQGAAQIAAIERSKPRFAKGVLNLQGPGTETSDSIAAYLSKGESVMTAEETRRSMGILEAIKDNKLDDSILKTIDFSGGRSAKTVLDLSPVVAQLKELNNKYYDIIEQNGLLYKVYGSNSSNKKKVRASAMGNY